MKDHDIERVLRRTLTDRAGTVTDGPAWDGAGDELDGADRPGSRRRWLAPLAAAVVVLAVAGAAIALRHNEKHSDSSPVAADQIPIPPGMKAVDALGVEIFVPTDFAVDDLCAAKRVNRPVVISAAPSCPPAPHAGTVVLFIASAQPPPAQCSEMVKLGSESACLHESVGQSAPPTYSYTLTWPKHSVTLRAGGQDEVLAARIIRSAHEVPVDRHECAAARAPIEPPGKHDPAAVGGAPDVPDDRPASSMGVCWYVANHLVAAATLGAKDASAVLHGVAAAHPLFSPVGTPSCSAVDHSDAVILSVHYAAGGVAEGILRIAGCLGRSTAQATFVSNLARLAAMPLALGYHS